MEPIKLEVHCEQCNQDKTTDEWTLISDINGDKWFCSHECAVAWLGCCHDREMCLEYVRLSGRPGE